MEVRTEKLTVEASGAVTLGAASTVTAGALAAVDLSAGYLEVPQIAGASLPAAAAGNKGYLVYNTTTNKLNFSTGSAWEAVTSA